MLGSIEPSRDHAPTRRHHFDIVEGLVARAQKGDQLSSTLDPRAVAWVMLATHYGSNLLAVLDPEVDLEKCKEVMLAMVAGGLTAEGTGSHAGSDKIAAGQDA